MTSSLPTTSSILVGRYFSTQGRSRLAPLWATWPLRGGEGEQGGGEGGMVVGVIEVGTDVSRG